jgi:Domain of unknown function (DUF4395)
MPSTGSGLIDPRGPRFGAAVTTVLLGLVLLTGSVWLLALQTALFALGVAERSPYSVLFRRVVRPRLGPPTGLEDHRPPRFAQVVGLGFALVGLLGAATGAETLVLLAVGAAFVAALLNATTGFCLGCEVYLLLRRITVHATRKEVSV